MKIFYYLLDVTVVHSWIINKQIIAQNNEIIVNVEKPMTLSAFKKDLVV